MTNRHRRGTIAVSVLRLTLFVVACSAVLSAGSLQPVSESDARAVASQWVSARSGQWHGAEPGLGRISPVYDHADRSTRLAWLVEVTPTGYVLVSGFRQLPPVKSFSSEGPFRSGLGGDPGFEAWMIQSLKSAAKNVASAAERGVAVDTADNETLWNMLLNSRDDAFAGYSGINIAVRDPLLRERSYSGGYEKPLAWGSGHPYNSKVPKARSIPERIWIDVTGNGLYTDTGEHPDIPVYAADGQWTIVDGTGGSSAGLNYYDADGSGDFTYILDEDGNFVSGENIWADRPGGTPGVYNQGIDIRVMPPAGMPGWVTPDGAAAGPDSPLLYYDRNYDGQYTYTTARTYPTGFVRSVAEIMRYWEWPDVGIGSHTFDWPYREGGEDPLLTVPLTAHFDRHYPWSRMPLRNLGMYSQAEIGNVAQVIYDLGVLFEVDFQLDISIMDLARDDVERFAHHMRYNRRAAEYAARRDFPNDAAWFHRIADELDAGRPVPMRVFAEGDLFAGVTVDGYDKTAGTANLYLLHCNIGAYKHWFALENIGGIPYGTPDTAFDDVLSQDAMLGILPHRNPATAVIEIFRRDGDGDADTFSDAVQQVVNSYGQRVAVLAYHPDAADPYMPPQGRAAHAAMSARMDAYDAQAVPPSAVVSGHAGGRIQASGDFFTDFLNVHAEVERRLAQPARYMIVGECVLGYTPAPQSMPVFKADVYVSRLDEQLPESETVTLRLFLVEQVEAGPRWVVRDVLLQQNIALGYGETRVVHVPLFDLPPEPDWDLENAGVLAVVERADGTVIQAARMKQYNPGPNYQYDDDVALFRERIVNHPPQAPTEVIITQNADGTEILCTALGAYDPDGDAIRYVVDWFVNGVQLPYDHPAVIEDGPIFISPADHPLTPGDLWHAEVRVRDAYYEQAPPNKTSMHESPRVLSNRLLITGGAAPSTNQPPSAPAFVTLVPEQPAARDEVTCLASGAQDPDGDPFSYLYTWFRDGVHMADYENMATLPYGTVQAGDAWHCEVRARDIWGAAGPAMASEAATIAEPRPGAPTRPLHVTVGPDDPSYISTLTCSEPTGVVAPDPVEYHYRWWTRVGASWMPTDMTAPTLDLQPSDIGVLYRCVVFARNTVTGAVGPSLTSNDVLVRNFAPTVPSIEVGPRFARIDDTLRATASATDKEDGTAVELYFKWYVDGQPSGIEGFGQDEVSGVYTSAGQVWTCSVYAEDQYGARSPVVTSTSVAHIGGPPTAPTRVPIYPARPESGDDLTCSPSGSVDPDGDPVFYIFQWYKEVAIDPNAPPPPRVAILPANVSGNYWSPTSTGQTVPNTLTAYGDRWACVVQASDGQFASPEVATQVVIIGNQPPSKPEIAVVPDKPVPGESLECQIVTESTDPEGDDFTYSFKWFRLGEDAPAYTGRILPPGMTEEGETWICEVTVTDLWSPPASNTVTSRPILLENTPPTAPNEVFIEPAFPKAGHPLQCLASGSVDPNGGPVNYVFEWFLDGAETAYATDTVPGHAVADGDQWQCRVTAVDNDGLTSNPVWSQTVTVGNRPPTRPTSVVVTPAPAGVDEDLICAAGGSADPNGDDVFYLFQWYLNGTAVPDETDYRLDKSRLSIGDVWKCAVRATDGLADSDEVFSNEVVIRNLPPTAPTTVVVGPATPTEIHDLTCSASGSSDPEGDLVAYAYQWFRNGLSTDHRTQRLDAANTAVGESWQCEVRAIDEHGNASSRVMSNTVEIISAAPNAPSVTVAPADPSRQDDLVCTATGSQDPLGGNVIYDFLWYRNRAGTWEPTGITAATVDSGYLQNGDIWKCGVRAVSAAGFQSARIFSNEVTVANHAPTPPTAVVITPNVPTLGQTLACLASGATDRDGDPIAYLFRWQNDGGVGVWADSGHTGQTVPDLTDDGYSWRCFVRASDGVLASPEVQSNVVKVSGHAPTPPDMVVAAVVDGDLECTASGSIDPDGDDLTYLFTWFRDGTEAGLSGVGVYDPATDTWHHRVTRILAAEGETWFCRVVVLDERGATSAPADSNELVVQNHPPKTPLAATLLPDAPTVNNNLHCDVTDAEPPLDVDGDTVAYLYAWYRNGVRQADFVHPVLPASATQAGDVWHCTVMARDSHGATSGVVVSNQQVIQTAGNDAFENDDHPDLAQEIMPDDYQLRALQAGDTDWVTFTTRSLREIQLQAEVVSGTVALDMALFAADNFDDPIAEAPDAISRLVPPGTYYLRIRPAGPVVGEPWYSLIYLSKPARALGTATALSVRQTELDRFDWAYFQLATPAVVTVTANVVRGDGDLELTLFTADYELVAAATAPDVAAANLPAGVYFVRMAGTAIGELPRDLAFSLHLAAGNGGEVVANVPPSAPATVRLFPGEPVPRSRLRCVAYGARKPEDAAESELTYYFYWYHNDRLRDDLSGPRTPDAERDVTTVDSAYLSDGDTWFCDVVVLDEIGVAGPPVRTQTVTVNAVDDWAVTIAASRDATVSEVTIGLRKDATNAWDEGIDDVVPPGTLLAVEGVDELRDRMSRDFRSFKDTRQVWYLQLASRDGVTLEWDPMAVPDSVVLSIAEVTEAGATIPGTEVDMLSESSLDVSGASAASPRYRITALVGGSTYETIPLYRGWNLISFALKGEDDAVENIFAGLNTGSVWRFDTAGNRYVAVTQVNTRDGYWILARRDSLIEHIGLPTLSGTIPLRKGWNLIGPSQAFVLPQSAAYSRNSVTTYDPLTGSYVAPTNFVLQPNRGYWIYAVNDTEIEPR